MGWLSALAVATGWKKEPLAVAVVPRNPGTVSTKSRKSRRAAADLDAETVVCAEIASPKAKRTPC
jgi:hypothetical protein